MAVPITATMVRNALGVSKTDGLYSEGIIGSNIRAAHNFIQIRTGRQFEAQTNVTKSFTTHNQASIRIPDLRTASSVTVDQTALTADESYWLVPDFHNNGIYIEIQFRRFDILYSYKADPLWWDKNYDSPLSRWRSYSSATNNLSITGDWGWNPLPEEFIHAETILAAWFTKRPEAVLSDVVLTPEGGFQRFSEFPPEVQAFIEAWRLIGSAAAI